jgi:aminopeptidase N
LKADVAQVLRVQQDSPNTPVVHERLSDMGSVLNWFVFAKGAWVLHMLRGLIGTDAFWDGIREYYALYRDRNASTSEFRQVMERVSGRDLEWFFRQWLNGGGVPRLTGTWRYDALARRLELTLAQTQSGEPFRLPLDIGIAAEPHEQLRIERVELTTREATFAFPAGREPSNVALDPGVWLLTEAGPFTRASP